MAISYKRLWKLLIDRDLKKKDLQVMAGISAASITKLGKNENVNTEIIEKICHALQCDFSDIMELTKDEHDQEVDVVKSTVIHRTSQSILQNRFFCKDRSRL